MVEASSSLDSLHASLSLNKVERLLKADETKALEEMLASTNMMAIDPLDPGFAANPDDTSLADLQDDPILAQLPAKVDGQDATAAGLVAQEENEENQAVNEDHDKEAVEPVESKEIEENGAEGTAELTASATAAAAPAKVTFSV